MPSPTWTELPRRFQLVEKSCRHRRHGSANENERWDTAKADLKILEQHPQPTTPFDQHLIPTQETSFTIRLRTIMSTEGLGGFAASLMGFEHS